MGFVQVIQFRTSRIDEMMKVADHYQSARDRSSTVERVVTCQDRDNPGQYFTFAFFDSYDAAMENSELPATREMSQSMMSLADGPPTFFNLDILDDRTPMAMRDDKWQV
jgi:hypothetical protein